MILLNTHLSPYTELKVKMTDCILIPASLNRNGYGQLFYQGKNQRAHRVVWMRANGPIPKDKVIDHICHNPKECEGGITCSHRACINLDHMRLTTQQENIMAGLHNIDNRSHCNQGHPFIKENIMVRKSGKRECSQCNRERSSRNWANRKVGS
jgi:hypothetical protein